MAKSNIGNLVSSAIGADDREAHPKFWIAVYTRPRSEKKAAKMGITTYVPTQHVMIQRICTLVVLFLIGSNHLFAGQGNIEDLMKDNDYILAALVVVSPGTALYSAGGHLAIRMTCPLQNIDYVYEFDASLNTNESLVLNYLNGRLKGEYVRLYSSDFFGKVEEENRMFYEYPLNLTPDQEVKLWSNLDNAVDSNSIFPFTPAKYNCCSMILSIIDESVQPGIFSSQQVSNALKGSRRHYIDDFFSNSTWKGLFWNIILGIDFDKSQETIFLYYPKIIGKYVSLIYNPINNKPLISKELDAKAFFIDKHELLTPSFVFIILLICAICLTVANAAGKLIRFSIVFDIFLMAVITIIGCILWYMFVASLFSDTLYFNILMVLFTPLPLILLFIRKRNAWIWYMKSLVVISSLLLLNIFFITQIQLYCTWAFVTTILVRGLYYTYSSKYKIHHKTIIT